MGASPQGGAPKLPRRYPTRVPAMTYSCVQQTDTGMTYSAKRISSPTDSSVSN